MSRNANIARLLGPSSIAVVGATDRPGPGLEVARNAVRSAEAGVRVYLINPNRRELLGHSCHPSLGALPEAPDSVIIATSPRVAVPVLEEAASVGAGSATILSSGFAESSEANGAAHQREVVRIADAVGMAVCGPNCLGIVDFERRIFAASMAFPEHDPGIHPRSVAVISQSGGLMIGLVNRAVSRRLALRCAISSGNEAVTGVEDYLAHLLDDPAIAVVALVCEGFRDLERLTETASRARERGKRVALMTLGRTARGRSAVRAHTGREAAENETLGAALADAGIARFDRTDELVEFCHLATRYPSARGAKLSAVMVSGGAAALACDAAERHGLRLADWSDATLDALRRMLPDYATASNPLDLTGGTMLHNREAIERALRLIADDPETGVIGFVFPLQPDGGAQGMRDLVAFLAEAAARLDKPFAVISTGTASVTEYWAAFSTRVRCPLLEDVDTAFAAFAGWSV